MTISPDKQVFDSLNALLDYNFKSLSVTASSDAFVTCAAYFAKRFMCSWV